MGSCLRVSSWLYQEHPYLEDCPVLDRRNSIQPRKLCCWRTWSSPGAPDISRSRATRRIARTSLSKLLGIFSTVPLHCICLDAWIRFFSYTTFRFSQTVECSVCETKTALVSRSARISPAIHASLYFSCINGRHFSHSPILHKGLVCCNYRGLSLVLDIQRVFKSKSHTFLVSTISSLRVFAD